MYLFHLKKAKFIRSTVYQIRIDGFQGHAALLRITVRAPQVGTSGFQGHVALLQ